MQITPDAIAAIYYNFQLRFQAAYDSAEAWALRLATVVPSTTAEERYPVMARLPAMREWVGERVFNDLTARNYSLVNRDWELSVEIDRNTIEDDRIGVFTSFIDYMGNQARLWPDHRLGDVLQAGNSSVCIDGQFFFDTDHPVNSYNSNLGTYANLFTGSPLNMANVGAVRASMRSYQGEDGKPLLVNPKLLVVPPQLEQTAAQICQATMIAPAAAFGANAAGGFQENVLKGAQDYLVVPQLADEPDVWYFADVSKPIKPLLWQLRKAPVFVSVTDPTSEPVFLRKKFQYGTDSRGEGGYSMPFLMARCETA